MVNTVDKVDVWEAVLTLVFVPIVVFLNWVADKGWLDKIFCQIKKEKVYLGLAELCKANSFQLATN